MCGTPPAQVNGCMYLAVVILVVMGGWWMQVKGCIELTDRRIGLLHLSISFAQRAIERFQESGLSSYHVSGKAFAPRNLEHNLRACI